MGREVRIYLPHANTKTNCECEIELHWWISNQYFNFSESKIILGECKYYSTKIGYKVSDTCTKATSP